MITTAERLEGIGEYYFAMKLREIDAMNRSGADVINLGIGSPDLPPHPDVVRVLQEEAARPGAHGYQSYKGAPVLRRAMSDWYARTYGVALDPDREILPLIGSKEGIMHVCMTYLDRGDAALVPNPGYPTYRSAVRLAGGVTVDYTLSEAGGWQPDFEAMDAAVAESKAKGCVVKLLFANYPHMPTGALPAAGTFERLAAFAERHRILVVHDNPYSTILNDNPASALAPATAKAHVLELNSLSKTANMAGWRVGMLCGDAQRIDEVMRFKSNMDSGMFLPVQLAAAKALSLGADWYGSVNAVYRERRGAAYALLELLGCRFQQDQAGMFAWARIPGGYADSHALSDSLLQRAKVFLTPGAIFGDAGKEFIRISLCSPIERMREAIARVEGPAGEKITNHG